MNTPHVKEFYIDWSEGRLDEALRTHIQEHLGGCAECSDYFAGMSRLLEGADPGLLPKLKADPHLPTRIRAHAGVTTASRRRGGFRWARVPLAGAILALAIAIGVYLGVGLSTAVASGGETEIINAYYEAFTQQDATDGVQVLYDSESEDV